MSLKRLFDAVERRDDIGRRLSALILPISHRPRVTFSSTGKIGLREPSVEHGRGKGGRPAASLTHRLLIRPPNKKENPGLFEGPGTCRAGECMWGARLFFPRAPGGADSALRCLQVCDSQGRKVVAGTLSSQRVRIL
jgi:hypothetical protein